MTPVTNGEPPADAEVTPSTTGPKRQHYVPRFYLRSFAGSDDCLAVYDRSSGTSDRRKPEAIAVEGHYYTLTDDQGRRRFEVENALASIEGKASLVLPKLIRGASITDEERFHFSYFVATLAVRTPAMVKTMQSTHADLTRRVTQIALSDPKFAYQQVKSDPQNIGKTEADLRDLARRLYEFASGDDYTIEVDKEFAVTQAIQLGDILAPLIMQRDWQLLTTIRSKGLVTSDSPVILTSLYRQCGRPEIPLGFGSAHALIYLPLSTERGLLMSGDRARYGHGEFAHGAIAHLNQLTAKRSVRFTISRDDRLLSSTVRKAHLKDEKWNPVMRVG